MTIYHTLRRRGEILDLHVAFAILSFYSSRQKICIAFRGYWPIVSPLFRDYQEKIIKPGDLSIKILMRFIVKAERGAGKKFMQDDGRT